MARLLLLRRCQSLQFLFAPLLPDRDIPALEAATEISEHFAGAPDLALTGKHSGQVVVGLSCRYNRADFFVNLHRIFEALFCLYIVGGGFRHEQQPLQEVEARFPPVRGQLDQLSTFLIVLLCRF